MLQLQTDDHAMISPVLLTRRCLIGAGIVSGMELALDEFNRICITSGKAITSDGTYVEITSNQLFSFYREFTPVNDYTLFKSGQEGLHPVWEIITADQFVDTDQPLNPQSNREKLNPFLKDKIVILYLDKNLSDSGDKEKDKLPKSQSENKAAKNYQYSYLEGKELGDEYGLRFLLMRLDDVTKQLDINRLTSQMVWERLKDDEDYIYSDSYNPEDTKPIPRDINLALNPALRLPEIPFRRFGFGKGDPYDCPPGEVDQSEFPNLTSLNDIYDGYQPAIDEAIGDLDFSIRKLYKYYHPLLLKFPQWNIEETLDVLCDKWEAYKRNNQGNDLSSHKKEYIQYFYDWVRDLLSAYHELRILLIDFSSISLSGTNSFPCHLLLGEPLREDVTKIPRPFRQHFKQPAIYNGQADRLLKIRLYFWRLLVLIKNFYLPNYIDETSQKHCNNGSTPPEEDLNFTVLKVTPGKYFDQNLGEQTMPYYYYPIARHRFSLHHFWYYERTKNSSTDKILSFHANDGEDSYTDQVAIIRPLHYNLDQYSFLRIEGHIGQSLIDSMNEGEQMIGVLNKLHYIKRKYNLGFGIVALPITEINPLSKTYPEQITSPSSFESFYASNLGMEHLGGVQKGGTFVFVYDENWKVIADFSMPYHCCSYCFSAIVTDCLTNDPVANVAVKINSNNQEFESRTITSDEAGYFRVCLKTGHYNVSIAHDGYDIYEREIHLDGDLITPISLINPTGTIEGKIHITPPLNDTEQTNTTIHVFDGKTAIGSTRLQKENEFKIEGLPPKKLTLLLRIRGNDVPGSANSAEIQQCRITNLDWEIVRPQVEEAPAPPPGVPGDIDFETRRNAIIDIVGRAPLGKRNDLKLIKGIGPKAAEVFNRYGISTFKQLGKMKKETFDLMAVDLNVKPKLAWAKEAAKLARNA